MASGYRSDVAYVADTHMLLWYLQASPLLGPNAKVAMFDASPNRAQIIIPSIVVAELFYLTKKYGNLDFLDAFQRLSNTGNFIFTGPPGMEVTRHINGALD